MNQPVDNGCQRVYGYLMPEYRIADAPKYADMIEHDCAECAFESLTRPVWLTDGARVFPVGSGCAARLTGRAAAEWEADAAARRIAATPGGSNLMSYFSTCLPARMTPKFVRDAARWAFVEVEVVEVVAEAYRALKVVGAVRSWRDRLGVAA